MRITKEFTSAVLVDVQERLFSHIFENDRLAKNTATLISGLQALQVPVFVTEQYTRGLGTTIDPLRSLFANWQPLEKITFSCADSDAFQTRLQNANTKHVILFGIEAHICVLQTAIDLKAAGYIVVVVEDCISSRRESDKNVALKRLQTEGILLTTLESILFELCRTADSPAFKNVSRLVK